MKQFLSELTAKQRMESVRQTQGVRPKVLRWGKSPDVEAHACQRWVRAGFRTHIGRLW